LGLIEVSGVPERERNGPTAAPVKGPEAADTASVRPTTAMPLVVVSGEVKAR
jgi:hypothetical protein